jgi:ABC-type branched-subunit amino acid transport system substrate-binding protein
MKTTYIIGLLLVTLLLGCGVGYYLSPPKTELKEVTKTVYQNPLQGKKIVLGSTCGTAALEWYVPYQKQIVLKDINDYLKTLGYDLSIDMKIDEAPNTAINLEKVQAFHSQGIDLMTGYAGSSYVQAVLPYINQNGILLVTPGATSPLLSAKDNFFRLTPNDFITAPAIAEMISSWGIKACLFIELGDSFGDGIWNIFQNEFPKRGGVIIERIRYATGTSEFSSYLETANRLITDAVAKYGAEKVAIEIVAGDEVVTLITQASSYPALMNVYWFSSDTTIRNQRLLDDAPKQTGQVKFFGPFPAPGYSEKYNSLAKRYYDLVKLQYNFNCANQFDIDWIITNSVLYSGSTATKDVIPQILHTADQTFGASGWCTLDENGDRKIVNMEIRGFGIQDGKTVSFLLYAIYDGVTGKVSWDTTLITPGTPIQKWVP